MQKIMIIGSSGAGKTTLARTLHELTGLELLPLDRYYFLPNWVECAPDEWAIKVKQLSEKPTWIIDGNYGRTMDVRLEKADTLIFLDFPTWVCFYRVIKRTLQYYQQTRPDMAPGCKERFSLGFLAYVLHFRQVKRPKIMERLSKIPAGINVYILKNNKEVQLFLSKVKTEVS